MSREAGRPQNKAIRVSTRPEQTLSAAITLTVDQINATNVMSFDTGGTARVVTLPAMPAGTMLWVINSGATTNVTTHDGSANVAVITPGIAALNFVDYEGNWYKVLSA